MNKTLTRIGVLLLTTICLVMAKKEVLYYDFCETFYESNLGEKSIAIVPIPSDLRASESTDRQIITTALGQYAYAVAKELEKGRTCLKVLYPDSIVKIAPDIYKSVAPIRSNLKNGEKPEKDAFLSIKKELNVDYLLLVEKVHFTESYQMNSYAEITYRTTSMDYQLWELQESQVLLRAKLSSSGKAYKDLKKDYDKKSAAVRIAKAICKDLPKCQ